MLQEYASEFTSHLRVKCVVNSVTVKKCKVTKGLWWKHIAAVQKHQLGSFDEAESS